MAKVLSSISGNLISAASAGFAPTNSADVSAIASAYQVVSATGTQLYAGTAHVTSINSAPISASRAGNAANASLANSAYYDGTGRLISALPDSAAVSSIASSYAPTFGLNAGKISSINGSALDTPTGSQVVTATGSALVGGVIGISSINGSALSAKEAYSASRATYDDYGDNIRSSYAKQSAFSGVSSTVANNSASWGQGGSVSSLSGTIFVSGDNIEGTNSAVLTASSEEGFSTSFAAIGAQIPSWTSQEIYAGTLPGSGATLYISTNMIMGNTATAIISGKDSNMAIVTASGLASEDPIAIYLGAIVNTISASANTYIPINGDVTAEKTGGITVTGIGELAWASSVSGVVNTVSSNSATWGQGGVDSTTVSAIASSYAESAVSSKQDSSAMSAYALSSNVSGVIDTVSANSASWTTDLTDYATTAYVDSSVSSKLDSSASSSFYTTANESGYVGSAYVDSAVSGKMDTFSAGEGLEFVQSGSDQVLQVEAPVDIVAGPGIVIDNPDGNTLRVSTDENYETVLWTGDTGMIIGSSSGSCSLSESAFNFEKIGIYAQGSVVACIELHCFEIGTSPMTFGLVVSQYESNETIFNDACVIGLTGSTLSYSNGSRTELKTAIAHRNDRGPKIVKIVGIHRTASN